MGTAISGVTLASLGAASTANVGTYALSASNAQGSGLSNYNITYVDASTGLTVTPATLTITASEPVQGLRDDGQSRRDRLHGNRPRHRQWRCYHRGYAGESGRGVEPQMSGPMRCPPRTRRARACRTTTSAYVDASTGLTVTPGDADDHGERTSPKFTGRTLTWARPASRKPASSPPMAMLSPGLRSLASARPRPQMSGPMRCRPRTRRARASRITISLTSTSRPA